MCIVANMIGGQCLKVKVSTRQRYTTLIFFRRKKNMAHFIMLPRRDMHDCSDISLPCYAMLTLLAINAPESDQQNIGTVLVSVHLEIFN